MALFLFRFYPVFIPLIVYLLWLFIVRRKARKQDKPLPSFYDGKVYWVVISSLLIGIVCFLWLAFSIDGNKGKYIPSHFENGKMIPSQILPQVVP